MTIIPSNNMHELRERKNKAIEVTVPWPDHPDLLFRCLGSYDSKCMKWRLDLATAVGPVPAALLESPPNKIVEALLIAALAQQLEQYTEYTVLVKADRLVLDTN
jgi:hypothetical protein